MKLGMQDSKLVKLALSVTLKCDFCRPKEVTWLRQDLRYGGYSVYSERALYSYTAKGTHTGNSEELGALMPSTTNI